MSSKLSYLAGIIDGEGTITLGSGRSSTGFRIVEVSVANTHKGLIDWLQEEFGGSVRLRRGRKAHYKPLYEWRLRGEEAVSLIRKVRRYLRIKRPRADLICAEWKPLKRGAIYTVTARTRRKAFEDAVLGL